MMKINRWLRIGLIAVFVTLLLLNVGHVTHAQDWPPIKAGQTVKGEITKQNDSVFYSFDGKQGDMVSMTMTPTSGDLKPLISFGYLEKDESAGINMPHLLTNSQASGKGTTISDYKLPKTQKYYILATRIGVDKGTTTRKFTLSFTGASG